MPPAPKAGTVPQEEVERILAKAQYEVLTEAELQILRTLAASYYHVTEQLRVQTTTAARLRRFLGITTSEKTADVLRPKGGGAAADDSETATPPAAPAPPPATAPADFTASAPGAAADPSTPAKAKPKAKGHGRVPASAYLDAQCTEVSHQDLRPGDVCPRCGHGKLYELPQPAQILRIVGQAPLVARCWKCQRLRCGGCGHVFTAPTPEAALPKYDETAVAMMALLRYRAGMPLHRLDHLERQLATPVPASTQWDVVNQHVSEVRPVFDELCLEAAQGEVVHNDDSYARILAFMGKRRAALLAKGDLADPERTGIFTTAIVSIVEDMPIALFFTSRKHAGENLTELLRRRAAGRAVPLLMSDALDRNVPAGHPVVEANCLAHGRRHIVAEVANFPAECQHMLLLLLRVFRIDHLCRRFGLSPDQRLRVHQRWSGPVMEELQAWMTAPLAEKRIEANSGLGKAMNYLLKRWEKFTRFLRVPGAPLDNNICERALKMAIRHRNNSLFYRSQRGANVGDICMTLIHTAELHGVNPFDYLTALLRHPKAVAEHPAEWLPWKYRETLARLETGSARSRHPTLVQEPPPPRTPPPPARMLIPAMTAPPTVAPPSV